MTDGPDDDRRGAVLLIRVWAEGDDVRARLVASDDLQSPSHALGAAQGVDGICDVTRRWLEDFAPDARPHGPGTP